jgi:hypothetical protein
MILIIKYLELSLLRPKMQAGMSTLQETNSVRDLLKDTILNTGSRGKKRGNKTRTFNRKAHPLCHGDHLGGMGRDGWIRAGGLEGGCQMAWETWGEIQKIQEIHTKKLQAVPREDVKQ